MDYLLPQTVSIMPNGAGLLLPDRLTDDEQGDIEVFIAITDNLSRWARADYILWQWERKRGAEWDAEEQFLMDYFGISQGTLRSDRTTAINWPPGWRLGPPVTFEHHARIPGEYGNVAKRLDLLETWVSETEKDGKIGSAASMVEWMRRMMADLSEQTVWTPSSRHQTVSLLSSMTKGKVTAEQNLLELEIGKTTIRIIPDIVGGAPRLVYLVEGEQ